MRIDEEEIRFWIRKIKVIDGNKNTNIETDLFNEIPRFLRYLIQQPAVDTSKSRMVFTMDEIGTQELHEVKDESKSWLRKELEIELENYFNNDAHGEDTMLATPRDVKNRWFKTNHQVTISYIRKVVKNEMKLECVEKSNRYYPFNADKNSDDPFNADRGSVTGRPYIFKKLDFIHQTKEEIEAAMPF